MRNSEKYICNMLGKNTEKSKDHRYCVAYRSSGIFFLGEIGCPDYWSYGGQVALEFVELRDAEKFMEFAALFDLAYRLDTERSKGSALSFKKWRSDGGSMPKLQWRTKK